LVSGITSRESGTASQGLYLTACKKSIICINRITRCYLQRASVGADGLVIFRIRCVMDPDRRPCIK
jgi:hypothetical protein